jgi:hypothetical protein
MRNEKRKLLNKPVQNPAWSAPTVLAHRALRILYEAGGFKSRDFHGCLAKRETTRGFSAESAAISKVLCFAIFFWAARNAIAAI